MNQIIDALNKVSDFEDQVLIGENRVQRNIDTAIKILLASREADLGPSSNQVVDALVVIAKKLKQIVGGSDEVDAVA